MLTALGEDSFHDVRLVGTDNKEVPANKFMLATRSQIFKTMFFGDFRESKSETVPLNYSSSVLTVLVKYCYSDELDLSTLFGEKPECCLSDEEAISLVQLLDAANYLQFEELLAIVSSTLCGFVLKQETIGCVCAVLTELMARGGEGSVMWRMMMAAVHESPKKALLPTRKERNKGVVQCSPGLLRKLLDQVNDQFIVVRCIQEWFKEHPDKADEGETKDSVEEERALIKTAKEVNLKSFKPYQLSQIKPCSVFEMERLFEAYVYHGSIQRVPSKSPPSTSREPESFSVLVVGSGVECLNGTYLKPFFGSSENRRVYHKSGKYGGLESTFTIEGKKKKWTISVSPLVSTFAEEAKKLRMYEAEVSDMALFSFASWRCCDGEAPAPYVAMLPSTKTKPEPDFKSLSSQQRLEVQT